MQSILRLLGVSMPRWSHWTGVSLVPPRTLALPSRCPRQNSRSALGCGNFGEDSMKRSTDRILTTHVGSLPRPDDLRALILQKQQGQAIDEAAFAARAKSAVGETVRRQAEAGIDIVADGEMGRIGFIPYVNERLAGIEPSASAESAN